MKQTENTSTDEIRIIRGKVDSLSLYEITDNELETLEKGSPSSTYLNFAIFLLSVGFSFLVSLLTVKVESMKTYIAFMIFTVIGILAGVILLVLWYRERRSISKVIKKIKGRIPNTEIMKEDTESLG
jgi:multidrug transporter EmrE-like cation transporter